MVMSRYLISRPEIVSSFAPAFSLKYNKKMSVMLLCNVTLTNTISTLGQLRTIPRYGGNQTLTFRMLAHSLPTELHAQKRTTCSELMKTTLNNVVLPTLFNGANNIVQHCYMRANSGSSMLNNIVDNIEQCGQHNII